MSPAPFLIAMAPTLHATAAAALAVMRSANSTTTTTPAPMDMDVDMDMGELEESMDRMDIDTTTTTVAGEDMDLLAVDLDVAFHGLGTTSPTPPPPPPPTSPSPSISPSPPPRNTRSVVKYYYDYEAFTAEAKPDFGVLRRNIRHIDSVVRSLATEPYNARRLALRDLYRPFAHMTRTLASLKNCGWDSLTESYVEVGKYICHMRNLNSIVSALGSQNDETRTLKNAVGKLERTRLPEQKIIRLKVPKRGSTSTDTTPSTTTTSTAGLSGPGGPQMGASDAMDIDEDVRITGLSQRLRRFRMD